MGWGWKGKGRYRDRDRAEKRAGGLLEGVRKKLKAISRFQCKRGVVAVAAADTDGPCCMLCCARCTVRYP